MITHCTMAVNFSANMLKNNLFVILSLLKYIDIRIERLRLSQAENRSKKASALSGPAQVAPVFFP